MNTYSFTAMNRDQIKQALQTIQVAYHLTVVTLTDGSNIFGGLAKVWREHEPTLLIRYNNNDGRRFSRSYFVAIPIKNIADVLLFPISRDSLPIFPDTNALMLGDAVPVWDYPNPLASIIFNHNTDIYTSNDFEVWGYTEKAFSSDAVPANGIKLDNDYLFYVDWEFFSQHTRGSVGVSAGIPGVIDISKDMSPSLHQIAARAIKGAVTEKMTKALFINERWLRGCVLVQETPPDTYINGEKSVVIMCVSTDKRTGGELFPVIIKLKFLNYPIELLGHIVSQLTFYGEDIPAPVSVAGNSFEKALLARGIAYFKD